MAWGVCPKLGNAALEPGQVLEVGGERQEEQVDLMCPQELVEPAPPARVVEPGVDHRRILAQQGRRAQRRYSRGVSMVAVVGLGEMGRRVAARLLDAGHRVTVWNRTPERAAGLVELGAEARRQPCGCGPCS